MPDETNGVNDALRAMAVAQEAEQRRAQRMFEHLMHTAVPDPEELRRLMLYNLTLTPAAFDRTRMLTLALSWMRADPQEWRGFHPEMCLEAAQYNDIGERI